jgi:hypothetical protein
MKVGRCRPAMPDVNVRGFAAAQCGKPQAYRQGSIILLGLCPLVRMNVSISQRSWRQNLAQGEASAASETLGNGSIVNRARLSGRQNHCSIWFRLSTSVLGG